MGSEHSTALLRRASAEARALPASRRDAAAPAPGPRPRPRGRCRRRRPAAGGPRRRRANPRRARGGRPASRRARLGRARRRAAAGGGFGGAERRGACGCWRGMRTRPALCVTHTEIINAHVNTQNCTQTAPVKGAGLEACTRSGSEGARRGGRGARLEGHAVGAPGRLAGVDGQGPEGRVDARVCVEGGARERVRCGGKTEDP
jgi:hypothetical protein